MENLIETIIEIGIPTCLFSWIVLHLSKKYQWVSITKLKAVMCSFLLIFISKVSQGGNIKENLSKMWLPIQLEIDKNQIDKVLKLKNPDPKKAFELLHEYANGGNIIAKSHVFGCYIREDIAESYGVKTNFKKAIERYDELVKVQKSIMDHPKFSYLLGLAYCQGDDSLRQDTAKGIRYLEQAIAKNDDEACILLGVYYFYGADGIPIDEQKGLNLIHQAADRGFAEAQYLLGTYYYEIDEAKSISYLETSASQGHEGAINALNKINSNIDASEKAQNKGNKS